MTVEAVQALIPLEAHLQIPGPAERNVITNRIQHENRLVVGFVDHGEGTTESHDEPIEGPEKGIISVPKGLHTLGGQIPPGARVDVVRGLLIALHHPCMPRETPIHDLDIGTCGLKVLNDRDMEVHTEEPHLGIPLL
jgi:hypothetical protein